MIELSLFLMPSLSPIFIYISQLFVTGTSSHGFQSLPIILNVGNTTLQFIIVWFMQFLNSKQQYRYDLLDKLVTCYILFIRDALVNARILIYTVGSYSILAARSMVSKLIIYLLKKVVSAIFVFLFFHYTILCTSIYCFIINF